MRKLFIIPLFILCFAFAANAQSPCADNPANCVLITPEAARAALVAHETVKAQALELKTLRDAVQAQKDITSEVKIELAKATGENTVMRQNDASNRAILAAMIPLLRRKSIGLINF